MGEGRHTKGWDNEGKKVTLSLFLVVEEIEIVVVLLVVGDVPVVNKASVVTLSISRICRLGLRKYL